MALLVAALPQAAHGAPDPVLSKPEVSLLATRMVPARKQPEGWGAAIFQALQSNGIATRKSNVCAVMAVIEQESTYSANPDVKGLGRMAEDEIERKLAALPLLSGAAAQGVKWFLANRPSPETSYLSLIRAARTERDLDLVFRNMAFDLFREYATTRLLNTPPLARRVDAVNPVGTIGSMQVSVAYAIAELEKETGRSLPMRAIWTLRDELYSREGGIRYGARMLLGYYAGYDSRLYVFADFNAGRYASRNAAFQSMVSALAKETLALDGDLLIYDAGIPAATVSGTEKAVRRAGLGLSDGEIRGDLLREKTYGFRDTQTYLRLVRRYAEVTGKSAPYAMVPQIKLDSPKLSRTMTTERFARAVMARHARCLKVRL